MDAGPNRVPFKSKSLTVAACWRAISATPTLFPYKHICQNTIRYPWKAYSRQDHASWNQPNQHKKYGNCHTYFAYLLRSSLSANQVVKCTHNYQEFNPKKYCFDVNTNGNHIVITVIEPGLWHTMTILYCNFQPNLTPGSATKTHCETTGHPAHHSIVQWGSSGHPQCRDRRCSLVFCGQCSSVLPNFYIKLMTTYKTFCRNCLCQLRKACPVAILDFQHQGFVRQGNCCARRSKGPSFRSLGGLLFLDLFTGWWFKKTCGMFDFCYFGYFWDDHRFDPYVFFFFHMVLNPPIRHL